MSEHTDREILQIIHCFEWGFKIHLTIYYTDNNYVMIIILIYL